LLAGLICQSEIRPNTVEDAEQSPFNMPLIYLVGLKTAVLAILCQLLVTVRNELAELHVKIGLPTALYGSKTCTRITIRIIHLSVHDMDFLKVFIKPKYGEGCLTVCCLLLFAGY